VLKKVAPYQRRSYQRRSTKEEDTKEASLEGGKIKKAPNSRPIKTP
jgi:hypothetical protein